MCFIKIYEKSKIYNILKRKNINRTEIIFWGKRGVINLQQNKFNLAYE